MAEARRVIPDIDFNGKSAKKSLDGLTEQIEYDDVASGASDTLSIQVFNKDMKFLKGWLPKKGDRITASLTFKNWTKEGADKKLSCGDFLLDEMKMTGTFKRIGWKIPFQINILLYIVDNEAGAFRSHNPNEFFVSSVAENGDNSSVKIANRMVYSHYECSLIFV